MRAALDRVRSEKGVIWTLALVLLALASLMVIPAVSQVSGALVSTNKLDQRLLDRYAADAGVEHALWRLRYESGFQALLIPTHTYSPSETFNGRTATISVTDPSGIPQVPPTAPPQISGDCLVVDVIVVPRYVTPDQFNTFTYTLYIHNCGENNIHFDDFTALLPPLFTYVVDSSFNDTGITFYKDPWVIEEPDIVVIAGPPQRQRLRWNFGSPRPDIEAGVTAKVWFQATATLPLGSYRIDVVVDPQENMADQANAPTKSPVIARYPQFDITSAAGSVALKVRAEKPPASVLIRSWQVQ